MRRVIRVIFVLVPLLVGCTTGRQAYIPVDSPLKTWTPPDADAYTPEPSAPPAAPPAKATPSAAHKAADKR